LSYGDRLLSIQRHPTGAGKQLGITDEKLGYRYDLLGRLRAKSRSFTTSIQTRLVRRWS